MRRSRLTPPAKVGRNDPCWCGSGKKYKKCHVDRERQAPLQLQEILDRQKSAWISRTCLHPHATTGCKGKIVEAHTIQRGGGLTRIARAGHVYGFGNPYTKMLETGLMAELRRVGLRDASTFTGFCTHHDNALFRPIETEPIVPTAEQAFLLGYRAFCREFFMKQRAAEIVPLMREMDRGKDLDAQIQIQEWVSRYAAENATARRQGALYKAGCDDVLLTSSFERVAFVSFTLDGPPDVACSGFYAPQVDFQGRRIQRDVSKPDTTPDLVSVVLTPTQEGGIGLLTWVGRQPASEAFATSLAALPNEAVPHAFVRLVFEYFENAFASPAWWDALPEPTRDRLLARMNEGGLSPEPPPTALTDDGLRTVAWTVTRRTSIGLS